MPSPKYNLPLLRKTLGLNQKELADRLGIKQSFLSSIETGKSPLPADKENRLRQLFPQITLEDYLAPGNAARDERLQPREHQAPNETGMLKELLNYFHSQAHKEQDEHHELLHVQLNSYQERNDRLTEKTEKLQEKIESLNARIEELRDELLDVRSENLRLKELLFTNNISY